MIVLLHVLCLLNQQFLHIPYGTRLLNNTVEVHQMFLLFGGIMGKMRFRSLNLQPNVSSSYFKLIK